MVLKNFKFGDVIIIVHDGILKIVRVQGYSTRISPAPNKKFLYCNLIYCPQSSLRLFDVTVDLNDDPIDFEFLEIAPHINRWREYGPYCSTHYPEYCI